MSSIQSFFVLGAAPPNPPLNFPDLTYAVWLTSEFDVDKLIDNLLLISVFVKKYNTVYYKWMECMWFKKNLFGYFDNFITH